MPFEATLQRAFGFAAEHEPSPSSTDAMEQMEWTAAFAHYGIEPDCYKPTMVVTLEVMLDIAEAGQTRHRTDPRMESALRMSEAIVLMMVRGIFSNEYARWKAGRDDYASWLEA